MNKDFDCHKCSAPLVEGETKYCGRCAKVYSPKSKIDSIKERRN